MDKSLIISNLKMLSRYLEKDIKDIDESIKRWGKCVDEFGEDTITFEDEIYKEALERNIENKKNFVKILNENNKLIDELREGGKGRDETD